MAVSLIDEVKSLNDAYLKWLRDQTELKQVSSEWVEITTPYLDRHNDFLSIYVRRDGDNFELTDDGYIINDLFMSGCSVENGQRAQFLKQTLMGFGVQRQGDSLTVRASTGNFSIKKHSLLQAMLAVDNIFYTTPAHVERLFLEDVTAWFEKNDVHYSHDMKVTGKSGYDHMFDFVIGKSRVSPERFVQTVTAPDKRAVSQSLFNCLDVSEARKDARFYIILNDGDRKVSGSALTAIQSYSFPYILWSRREEFRTELAA